MFVPKKIDKSHTNTNFPIVAIKARVAGIRIPLPLNKPVNRPEIKPVTVLISAFNPIGANEKKSSISPEKKPVTVPTTDPFMKDTYKIMSNTKSGITGKKISLDKTAAWNNEKNTAKHVVQVITFHIF